MGIRRTAPPSLHTSARPPADGRRKAAWSLIVLAPVSAEVTFSGVTMPAVWLLLPALVAMYGAGVLLLRELVVRSGRGRPSLLLMGLVYELAEDGLGLQALTSPDLYHAAAWGPRVLGLNTTYWETQVGYHTVFSVLVPVLLTDLLFPHHRGRPYLRRGGLAGTAVAAVTGVVLLRVGVAAIEDPGYHISLPATLALLAAITALTAVALRALPARTGAHEGSVPPPARPAPSPARVALTAGVTCVCFLGLLFPPGLPPDGPAIGSGAWVFVPMALAAALAAGAAWYVRRWTATPGWSDSHYVWLAGGALIGHTLYAVLTAPAGHDYARGPTALALALGAAMIAATAYLLVRLDHRVRRARQPGLTPSPIARFDAESGAQEK